METKKETYIYVKVSNVLYTHEETGYTYFQSKPRKNSGRNEKNEYTFFALLPDIQKGELFKLNLDTQDQKSNLPKCVLNWTRLQDDRVAGIKKKLLSLPHVGEKNANAIFRAYKAESLEMLLTSDSALDCTNFSSPVKDDIFYAMRKDAIYKELLSYFNELDISPKYAKTILEKYKLSTVDAMKTKPCSAYFEDLLPYEAITVLCATLERDDLLSQEDLIHEMLILHLLRQQCVDTGNLFETEATMQQCYSIELEGMDFISHLMFDRHKTFQKALSSLAEKGYVHIQEDCQQNLIYLTKNYLNEEGIVVHLKKIIYGKKQCYFSKEQVNPPLNKLGTKLSAGQKEAISMALTQSVSIITGGPGTGKTHVIQHLIAIQKALTPSAKIALLAPTGIASENLKSRTLMNAKTIDLFLGDMTQEKIDLFDHDLIIVDECSMIDADLCHRLFRAIQEKVRLVLVGDPYQLPPVGAGAVFSFLIQPKTILMVLLQQTFRQQDTSFLRHNSEAVLSTSNELDAAFMFSSSETVDKSFFFLEATDTASTLDLMLKAIARLIQHDDYGLEQIQVLSPVKNTEMGTSFLNHAIQRTFNSEKESCFSSGNTEFRLGDKVIHRRNNYKKLIFNGKTGSVLEIQSLFDSALTVQFPDKTVTYSKPDVQDLELAYAITIHKSQGCEYPVVLIPITAELEYNFSKNALYTAITRAKEKVIFVGDPSIFQKILSKEFEKRNSKIPSLI